MMEKTCILREVDSITSQLIKKYKAEKIILFGSAAWREGEINDIGLLIINDENPLLDGF
jgi:predicted nucleotidyltransferase